MTSTHAMELNYLNDLQASGKCHDMQEKESKYGSKQSEFKIQLTFYEEGNALNTFVKSPHLMINCVYGDQFSPILL